MSSINGGSGGVVGYKGRRELIFVVEGSKAIEPHWPRIKNHYIAKLVRRFCDDDQIGWLGLVVFGSRRETPWVQRSGWTATGPKFLDWLEEIRFYDYDGKTTSEALAETSMMFTKIAAHENQACQNSIYYKKHCVLIASTPPTDQPAELRELPSQSIERNYGLELLTKQKLFYDIQDVAKHFGQFLASLSVISPRKKLIFNKIFNKAKHNAGLIDADFENVKNPDDFFILLSKNFLEAHAALNPSGIDIFPMNQVVVIDKTSRLSLSEPSVTTELPENISIITTSIINENTPVPMVTEEPWDELSNLSIPALSHPPPREQSLPSSFPTLASQDLTSSNDHVLGVKSVINGISMSNSFVGQLLSLPSHNASFFKVWEGALSGKLQNQQVHIRLEAYRRADALETLANGWPKTMKIVSRVYSDVVDKFIFESAFIKQYAGKAEIVYFHKLDQPEVFYHMPLVVEWLFIQLPSQILLLYVTRSDDCWGGLLFQPNMEEPMSALLKQLQILQRCKAKRS